MWKEQRLPFHLLHENRDPQILKDSIVILVKISKCVSVLILCSVKTFFGGSKIIHSQGVSMKLPFLVWCGPRQIPHTCSKYALSTWGPRSSGSSINKVGLLPQGHFSLAQDADTGSMDTSRSHRKGRVYIYTYHQG